MTCWRFCFAANFTCSSQAAHMTELPASTRRWAARLVSAAVVMVDVMSLHRSSAARG
jgi:hypothetical protein